MILQMMARKDSGPLLSDTGHFDCVDGGQDGDSPA